MQLQSSFNKTFSLEMVEMLQFSSSYKMYEWIICIDFEDATDNLRRRMNEFLFKEYFWILSFEFHEYESVWDFQNH